MKSRILFLILFLVIFFSAGCATMVTGLSSSDIEKVKQLNTLSNDELKELYFEVCDKIEIKKARAIGAESQDTFGMGDSIGKGIISGLEEGGLDILLKIKRAIIREMEYRNMEIPRY